MKKSFFERLTGSYDKNSAEEKQSEITPFSSSSARLAPAKNFMQEIEEEVEEAQLTIDVYQTAHDIIIQAITAGIKPDDLDVSITQNLVTIKGKREDHRRIEQEDMYYQELYWGTFSRTITLPHDVDPDESEASLKNGILTIKLPKLDRDRIQKVKIKGD